MSAASAADTLPLPQLARGALVGGLPGVTRGTAETPGVFVGRYSLEPYETAEYCHPAEVLYMPLWGTARVRRTVAGERHYEGELTAGELCIRPAGSPEPAVLMSGGEFLSFYVDPGRIRAAAAELRLPNPDRVRLIPHSAVPDARLERLGRQLLAEGAPAEQADGLWTDALQMMVAVHLVRYYSDRTPGAQLKRPGDETARMRVVMDFIRANLARADLGLDLLAGVAEMDRLYFMQAFRRVAGVMPHEYLVRLRLREAKRLLKETQLPTDVVAACLGMHAARFRAVFTLAVGCAPEAYRIRQ